MRELIAADANAPCQTTDATRGTSTSPRASTDARLLATCATLRTDAELFLILMLLPRCGCSVRCDKTSETNQTEMKVMNDKFDELAKGLAQSVTRRAALRKFGAGLAGIA